MNLFVELFNNRYKEREIKWKSINHLDIQVLYDGVSAVLEIPIKECKMREVDEI